MIKQMIIFSTTYFPLVGGAEVAMKEITDRIPDISFDLICARIRPGLPSEEKIGNVLVHRVGIGRPIDKYLLPILGPIRAFRIESDTRRNERISKKVISDSGHASAVFIWSLMASYGGFASLVYTWIRPKTKMLLTIQEGDPVEHYAKRAGVLRFLHRAVFRRADVLQSISRFLADWAKEMGFRGDLHIVPNGVDVKKFAKSISVEERRRIRSSYGLSDADTVLVTASRLSLKNAVDDLIRSLAYLPTSYKVFIAGSGEDEEKIRTLVKELNVGSRVIFAGSKTHDELPAILQSSEIFIRASLSEGLGNAFLEAMASGIPIIGTSVGGIPDFLTDGETGVFCEVRNPESIAKAVLRIQNTPELRSHLIERGKKLVHEKYDWDEIARTMKDLIVRMH